MTEEEQKTAIENLIYHVENPYIKKGKGEWMQRTGQRNLDIRIEKTLLHLREYHDAMGLDVSAESVFGYCRAMYLGLDAPYECKNFYIKAAEALKEFMECD